MYKFNLIYHSQGDFITMNRRHWTLHIRAIPPDSRNPVIGSSDIPSPVHLAVRANILRIGRHKVIAITRLVNREDTVEALGLLCRAA